MTNHLKYQELLRILLPLYDDREANNIARIVFEDAFQVYNTQSEKPFDIRYESLFKKIKNRLSTGEPVQYVIGQTNFMDLNLIVEPNVLIPRPETEELVYWILQLLNVGEAFRVLDVGTGSGCIPVTLKHKLPLLEVFAVDISASALAIARENAQRYKTAIQFLQFNILDESQWPLVPAMNIIVSNPPYIPTKEKHLMPQQVINFEPSEALFVPDTDPLIFYKSIAELASKKLYNRGLLFFELNEFNAPSVVQLLESFGFQNIQIKKDMQAKDRMLMAEWHSSSAP